MAIVKTMNSIAQAYYQGEIQIRYIEDYNWNVKQNFNLNLSILGITYQVPTMRYSLRDLPSTTRTGINRSSSVKIVAFNGCNCRFKFASDGIINDYIIIQRNNSTVNIMLSSDNTLEVVTVPNRRVFLTIKPLYDNIETYKLIPTLWLSRVNDNLFGFNVTMYRDDKEDLGDIVDLYDCSQIPNVELDFSIYDDQYGHFSSSGGYGSHSFDDSSDSVSIPAEPSMGVTNTGFINIYNPTQGQLEALGDDLFPDFSEHTFVEGDGIAGIVTNIAEVGKTLYDLLSSFINSNLINYVIDCHLIPCKPAISGSVNVKIGFKTFPQVVDKVSSDYVTVDCGALEIAEYYQNFIDYVGTTAKLYLPFVGFVGIEPEFFQGGQLRVVYRFNIVDGSFMAYVLSTSSKSKLTDSVIASYGGNCCVHIPITGVNYSSMVTGVLAGTGATVSNLVGGNVNGVVDSALSTLLSKPTMESSNSYNSTSSFLGVRTPYLLISRMISSFSKSYRNENGLPLNEECKLSDLTGLTISSNMILDSLSCTDVEKDMIKNLLSTGIIL